MNHIIEQISPLMEQPAFLGHPVDAPGHLQTHISHVFLTGRYAYKIKKAINLGFLDFTTLEARRAFTVAELELNRRLAPDIYLEVLAIVRRDGRLALRPLERPGGEVVEYCLRMAEMDQDAMMTGMLRQGLVTPGHISEIAGTLAAFYERAERGPRIDELGMPDAVAVNVEENFAQTVHTMDVLVAPARWRAIRDYSLDFLRVRRDTFLRRVALGKVLDGHGDLHSGNINLPSGGGVHIFDCIEFNQRFRYQDAACDLAFLAMDLDYYGRPDLSRQLIRDYAEASGDSGVWEVLDFYKCYRAMVRAKIHGFMMEDGALRPSHRQGDVSQARAYFRLAARYSGEPPFFLVCVMGLMGTGKTHLAKGMARRTGWLRLSSDEMRKQMAGMSATQHSYDGWGQGLYSGEKTAQTYQALLDSAGSLLEEGECVVVEASFAKADLRRRFLDLARSHGAVPLLVQVRADRELVMKRLTRRQAAGKSVSDGRAEIYDQQAAAWEDDPDLLAAHGVTVWSGDQGEAALEGALARLEQLGWTPGG